MGWKNWPYWVRGGIIGALIGVIVTVILVIGFMACIYSIAGKELIGFACIALLVPVAFLFPLFGIEGVDALNYTLNNLGEIIRLSYFILIIVPIFLGVIVGFIVTLAKRKKFPGNVDHSWKNIPIWFRGGIFGFITAFMGMLLSFIDFYYVYLFDFIGLSLSIIMRGEITSFIFPALRIASMFTSYFLIGALIGFIIGKIKSKKQNEVGGT